MMMMNRPTRSLIFLFFIILTGALGIHAQPSPDIVELTRLLNEFLAGAGSNDAEKHDRFWAHDLIYTRSTGARTNKEELMKAVRSATPQKEGDPKTVYTAEEVKIQLYGDAAVVAFKLVSTTTHTDGSRTIGNNLNTGTFIKRNGEWRAVAWQSTVVPTAQPPVKPGTAAAANSSATTKNAAETPNRTYIKGPRGGCYYLNSSGGKVYVDKKYCP